MERRFGPYQLVRQIAAGGMAEIYLARTSGVGGFEKYVALKLIHARFANDRQFTQRLVDEAKIAVQLNHANIVQTFDLGRVGDTFYITMEYVDGADLFDVLVRCSERQVELPVAVCAHIAKEIARALDHAHGKTARDGTPLGIVHRDVSPHNVLVSRSGEVKLVDFGIAKAVTKVFQTATGVIQGKYHYMSPEQASGESIDGRSDVFSAGIVLYELLTGRMLYREVDLHRLLVKARRADIAPPSRVRAGVPPELERIVMRALARQPIDRYQSAGALAADLERYLRACTPVLYARKLGELLERVLADHAAPLDVARQRSDIRDDNSVLARLDGGTWPFAGAGTAPETITLAETPPVDADTLIAPMDDQMLGLDDERATAERPRVAPPAQNATPTQVAIEIATPTQIMVPRLTVTPPPAVFGIASVQLGVSTPAVGAITRVPGVPAHLLPYVQRDARPIPRPMLPPMPFAVYSGGVRLFEPYIVPARFVVPAGIKWWKVAVAVVVALALAYGCARCATEMWAPPPVVSAS
jgi:serine/threonine protein kinase